VPAIRYALRPFPSGVTLLVDKIKIIVASKMPIESMALVSLAIIAKLIKSEGIEGSQNEMPKMDDQSIISFDFNKSSYLV